MEGLYARLDDVPARWRATLAEHEALVRANKRLATIDRHVPTELDLAEARLEGYDRAGVLALFQELEFRTLVDKLPQTGDSEPGRSRGARGGAASEAGGEEEAPGRRRGRAARRRRRAPRAGDFLLHPVTISRSVVDHDLLRLRPGPRRRPGLVRPGSCPSLRGDHPGRPAPRPGERRRGQGGARRQAAPHLLAERGITLRGVTFDTMIAGYLSNPANRASTVSDLAFKELGQDVAGSPPGPQGLTLRDVAPACGPGGHRRGPPDPAPGPSLRDDLQQRSAGAVRDGGAALTPVLSRMERAGIKVDERILGRMARELAAQIRSPSWRSTTPWGTSYDQLHPAAGAGAGGELASPLTKRTKTGYSTDATVLEELAGVHPVIEHILRYRQLTKLKSTYVDALPALINPRTGRCTPPLTRPSPHGAPLQR